MISIFLHTANNTLVIMMIGTLLHTTNNTLVIMMISTLLHTSFSDTRFSKFTQSCITALAGFQLL